MYLTIISASLTRLSRSYAAGGTWRLDSLDGFEFAPCWFELEDLESDDKQVDEDEEHDDDVVVPGGSPDGNTSFNGTCNRTSRFSPRSDMYLPSSSALSSELQTALVV